MLQGALWQRKGWKEMDKMRAQLEDLRELRDLVRSLGRGGGWGPLRRAPVQYLDMKGRPGLLRTILEQQETRGLTRSDDISRLLPSEVPSRCLLESISQTIVTDPQCSLGLQTLSWYRTLPPYAVFLFSANETVT